MVERLADGLSVQQDNLVGAYDQMGGVTLGQGLSLAAGQALGQAGCAFKGCAVSSMSGAAHSKGELQALEQGFAVD
ncbi:hypothetical protein UMZ34_25455 [Halopseudomonas pachastrellae]|nr:hypothetical protein UMZ34_25455 [Halopseudomonas pachastrellae]